MKKLKLILCLLTLAVCMPVIGSEVSGETQRVRRAKVVDVKKGAANAEGVIELAEGKTLPKVDRVMVIDFNATWCGPCQSFAPIYHKVAHKFRKKATFYSVDVDKHRALAEKYQIQSIPCVIILRPGKQPVSSVGMLSEEEFVALLNKYL